MGCVVAPTDNGVFVVTAKGGPGVTAALVVAAVREIKTTASRKNVTSFLPRAFQRCVRTHVLERETMFLDCSLEKAAASTKKLKLQLLTGCSIFFCYVT
jgi:hypothetical protein